MNRNAARLTRGAISLSSSGHLPDIVGLHNGEAGDVAAGPRKTLDQAATDRVGDDRENNGDGARLLQQRRHMPVLRDGKLAGIISIRGIVAPAVVIDKVFQLAVGERLRLAMTAEDNQAPGGIGKQVSKLYVQRLHELAT